MLFDDVVPRNPDEPGPVWLTAETATFSRTPGGILRIEVGDRCYLRVTVLRAMPLSTDFEYLSVRCESEEVGIFRRLDDVAPEQRQLVTEELEQRYFRPRIVRVKRVQDQSGTFLWSTITDHGPADFSTRHPRHSVTRTADGRWIVTDLSSNRYEIVLSQMEDARSRRLLEEVMA